ncbi:type I-E CRISPR-associated protein Cse2/CasB [Streptomyces sp. MNP-20]|uniref:type I-E CRISPR-associated protein Cse2/CasB n=1 Tax=Streptomyces sp. MNP-20 TaxID=2721165 RepID=UPI00155378FA|nr:type I-E CRISPR-associated protein Cse2/CasB [Streptomyces sp. MNP-20]
MTIPQQTTARRAEPSLRPGKYQKFVARIETLCAQDPGVRVALRRGLRRDLDNVRGLHRIVAPWLPEHPSQAEERAFYAIAAMIADRPRHTFTATDTDETVPADAAETDEAPPTVPATAAGTAASPARVRRDSLGASYARAVLARAGRGLREETAEARLNLLTRQSLSGLHRHLPGSIRHLRDAGADIDYATLLSDLATWPQHSKQIARRWLQDYYRLRRSPIEEQYKARDDEEDAAPADGA